MEWYYTLSIIFAGLILLFLTGLPVAFSFMLLNLIAAVILFRGGEAIQQLVLGMSASVSTFVYASIPLYTFMGLIIYESGMATRAIDAADNFLGHVRARLALLTVMAGAFLGTMIGSVVASSAILSTTLLPEMLKRGYKKPMSIGPILGSGGLATVIPPSGLGLILASMMGLSISKFFMASLIPGILMAINYAIYILVRCRIQPDLAPVYQQPPVALTRMAKETALYILPLGVIIFAVLGLLFLGIATPSESAATGSFASLVLAAAYGKLKWSMVVKALRGSVRITVLILMIIVGSSAFSRLLAFSGTIASLTNFVVSIAAPPLIVHIMMLSVILFLGMWMDGTSTTMITIPIFLPVIKVLGIDPMWFAVTMLISMEIGGTSPPFGNIIFVVKALAPQDITMKDLYLAALPFIYCDLVSITIILFFPIIALWLPSMAR